MHRAILLGLAATFSALTFAQHVDSLRGDIPVLAEPSPPPMATPDNSDVRRVRNYAMQPPVIPHKIEGYQLDKNVNRCMFCHARGRTEQSQAPMISVTHFMDRDGNFLAELSPRRYFCVQCHVPQAPLNPLVGNRFVDVESMLRRGSSPSTAK